MIRGILYTLFGICIIPLFALVLLLNAHELGRSTWEGDEYDPYGQ